MSFVNQLNLNYFKNKWTTILSIILVSIIIGAGYWAYNTYWVKQTKAAMDPIANIGISFYEPNRNTVVRFDEEVNPSGALHIGSNVTYPILINFQACVVTPEEACVDLNLIEDDNGNPLLPNIPIDHPENYNNYVLEGVFAPGNLADYFPEAPSLINNIFIRVTITDMDIVSPIGVFDSEIFTIMAPDDVVITYDNPNRHTVWRVGDTESITGIVHIGKSGTINPFVIYVRPCAVSSGTCMSNILDITIDPYDLPGGVTLEDLDYKIPIYDGLFPWPIVEEDLPASIDLINNTYIRTFIEDSVTHSYNIFDSEIYSIMRPYDVVAVVENPGYNDIWRIGNDGQIEGFVYVGVDVNEFNIDIQACVNLPQGGGESCIPGYLYDVNNMAVTPGSVIDLYPLNIWWNNINDDFLGIDDLFDLINQVYIKTNIDYSPSYLKTFFGDKFTVMNYPTVFDVDFISPSLGDSYHFMDDPMNIHLTGTAGENIHESFTVTFWACLEDPGPPDDPQLCIVVPGAGNSVTIDPIPDMPTPFEASMTWENIGDGLEWITEGYNLIENVYIEARMIGTEPHGTFQSEIFSINVPPEVTINITEPKLDEVWSTTNGIGTIKWETTINDPLVIVNTFTILYTKVDGGGPWMLVENDILFENSPQIYDWDISSIPGGVYMVRVEAYDTTPNLVAYDISEQFYIEDAQHISDTVKFVTPTSAVSEGAGTHNVEVIYTPGAMTVNPPDVTVTYQVTDITTEPEDYIDQGTGTLIFPGGISGSQMITFDIDDDADFLEGDETFQIELTSAENAEVEEPSLHTVTIIDNDIQHISDTVKFVTPTSTISEGVGTHNVEVIYTPMIGTVNPPDVTVTYQVTDITTEPEDYIDQGTGTLIFPGGISGSQMIAFDIDDDADFLEGDETFQIELTSAENAEVEEPSLHTVTIIDNDIQHISDTVKFVTPTSAVSEGAGTHNVEVIYTPGAMTVNPPDVTVTYQVTDITTEPEDYIDQGTGTLIFPGGISGSQMITFDIDDDADFLEGDETFQIELTSAENAEVEEPSLHTVTIIDNDIQHISDTVKFVTPTSAVSEGAGTHNVEVIYTPGAMTVNPPDVTVTYQVTDITTEPEDYIDQGTGTLIFPGGISGSQMITFDIDDDADFLEGDETFQIELTSAENAEVEEPSLHTVTIIDNDIQHISDTVKFVTPTSTISEGVGTHNVEVIYTPMIGTVNPPDVTVTYQVTDITTEPEDYIDQGTGTLIFPGGVSGSKMIAFDIDDDADFLEGDETFQIELTSAENAEVEEPSLHTVTIIDNDVEPTLPTVQFVLADSTVTETDNTFTHSIGVTIDVPPLYLGTELITVTYAVIDGTATVANNDYYIENASGQFSFNPVLPTSEFISIDIIGDTEPELDESFRIILSDPVNATLGIPSIHTITILNDDEWPLTARSGTYISQEFIIADADSNISLQSIDEFTSVKGVYLTGADDLSKHDIKFHIKLMDGNGDNLLPNPDDFFLIAPDGSIDFGDTDISLAERVQFKIKMATLDYVNYMPWVESMKLDYTVQIPDEVPDFTLSLTDDHRTVLPGDTVIFDVNINRDVDFTQAINFTSDVFTDPTNFEAIIDVASSAFIPPNGTAGPTDNIITLEIQILDVVTDFETEYTITITGTSEDGLIAHDVLGYITVIEPDDYYTINITTPWEGGISEETGAPSEEEVLQYLKFTFRLYEETVIDADDYTTQNEDITTDTYDNDTRESTLQVNILKDDLTIDSTYIGYLRSIRHLWAKAIIPTDGKITIAADDSTYTMSFPKLIAGDVHPNNRINVLDFQRTISDFGSTITDLLLSDFNNDGDVNTLDLSYLFNSWFKWGDLPGEEE